MIFVVLIGFIVLMLLLNYIRAIDKTYKHRLKIINNIYIFNKRKIMIGSYERVPSFNTIDKPSTRRNHILRCFFFRKHEDLYPEFYKYIYGE